jgi:hypothetical protein
MKEQFGGVKYVPASIASPALTAEAGRTKSSFVQ